MCTYIFFSWAAYQVPSQIFQGKVPHAESTQARTLEFVFRNLERLQYILLWSASRNRPSIFQSRRCVRIIFSTEGISWMQYSFFFTVKKSLFKMWAQYTSATNVKFHLENTFSQNIPIFLESLCQWISTCPLKPYTKGCRLALHCFLPLIQSKHNSRRQEDTGVCADRKDGLTQITLRKSEI